VAIKGTIGYVAPGNDQFYLVLWGSVSLLPTLKLVSELKSSSIPPIEYAGGCEVLTEAVVYSFGVVLLEILIRKRPTDDMFNDGLSIVRFAEINIPDRVLEIVDPHQLRQELELSQETATADKEKGMRCLISALNIGLSCPKPSPSERISMQEVAAKLHRIKDAYIRGN
jgi:hypothetical protein